MYKVCFVDDEVKNYQLFEKLVNWEEKGFEIAGTAADGVEALQMYETLHPDLIFMDIQLPLMDGLECVRCIRAEDKEVQIVIVSAYGEFGYAQKAIRYGVQEYLLKPVSRIMLNQLVDKIKNVLDERHSFTPQEDEGAYAEYEIELPSLEQVILQSLAAGKPDQLMEQLRPVYEKAQRCRLKPDILREFTLDVLIHMKFCLKNLDEARSFAVLRKIKMEEIYKIDSPDALYSYLTEKVLEVFEKIVSETDRKRNNMVILQANAIAKLKYAQADFSVQEVAKQIGISKNYFVSLYKEKTGQGFWDYVTGLRMQKAKSCLQFTEDTLASIAEQTGYRNEFYFSKKFKEQEGISPKMFREKKRNIV